MNRNLSLTLLALACPPSFACCLSPFADRRPPIADSRWEKFTFQNISQPQHAAYQSTFDIFSCFLIHNYESAQ